MEERKRRKGFVRSEERALSRGLGPEALAARLGTRCSPYAPTIALAFNGTEVFFVSVTEPDDGVTV